MTIVQCERAATAVAGFLPRTDAASKARHEFSTEELRKEEGERSRAVRPANNSSARSGSVSPEHRLDRKRLRGDLPTDQIRPNSAPPLSSEQEPAWSSSRPSRASGMVSAICETRRCRASESFGEESPRIKGSRSFQSAVRAGFDVSR